MMLYCYVKLIGYNKFFLFFQKKCGFLVDCPTSEGGNTNTGNVAMEFFSVKSRNAICELVQNPTTRADFSELLSLFNQMLSVTQNVDTTMLSLFFILSLSEY